MSRDDLPRRRPRYDDDAELPSIEKRAGGGRSGLWVGLAIGAVGLTLLLCVGGIAIGILMTANDAPAVKMEGAWKGRWTVHGQQLDSIYTFRRDGTFREESFDMRGGRVNIADGRWHVQNGEVQIDWNNGGFEDATVRFIDRNTVEYRIIAHNDPAQIGLTTTFRRQ